MMQKKGFTPYIILAILFALFHVFAFVIPSDKTSTFWVAYGFSVTMFIIEGIVIYIAVIKTKTIKGQFLAWPILCVGAAYFVIQTIAFFPFKIFASIPCWVAIIVFSLILGIALICLIATKASANLVNRIDEKR